MALEYEGAPLALERKQEYISRRAAAKAEAPTLPVRIPALACNRDSLLPKKMVNFTCMHLLLFWDHIFCC